MEEKELRRYSRVVVDGDAQSSSRAMLRAVGFSDDDFQRPQIGIASTWAMTTPCNMHINELAEVAAKGADKAGGKAVIFNTITINVLERQRELATMRTFGTGIGRLATMLTVENVLMGVLGVIVGLPIGFAIAQYFAGLYQNELFDMPVVIYTRTYILAAAGALIVLLLAEIPAVRFVRRLDLPAIVREMAT